MRKWIYGVGCPEGNEDIYINRFKNHYEEVENYFRDRPQDLLVLDLAKGDGWEKLCLYFTWHKLTHFINMEDRSRVSEDYR